MCFAHRPIEGKGVSRVTMDLDGCAETDQIINHLEHVQAKITLLYSRRYVISYHHHIYHSLELKDKYYTSEMMQFLIIS